MFQTDVSWLDSSGNQVPDVLKQTKFRKSNYHLIKMSHISPLYHLAVIFLDEAKDPSELQHFMFADLESAVNSVADESTSYMQLLLQSPFELEKQSELREIVSVFIAIDDEGTEHLAFDSDAGRFSVKDESVEQLHDLMLKTLLWQSSSRSVPTALPK